MPDYDKIGREVRAILVASPVKPETEEGRMVADLRYPGWREKGMPPAVPTPDAVETWGDLWWADGEAVAVSVYGPRVKYRVHGDSDSNDVEWAGQWAGPVLERPVKRDG